MQTRIFHDFRRFRSILFQLGCRESFVAFRAFCLVDVSKSIIEYLRDELSTNSFLFINETKKQTIILDMINKCTKNTKKYKVMNKQHFSYCSVSSVEN